METEENQNQVSLRFPPPLEIAPRFPQSHNPDDDSPLPQTQNQKARKEPQRLKKPQPPSSGSSFDEKMLVPSCRIIAPTPLHNGCFAFPIFSGFRDRSGIGIETGVYKALTGETGNGQ